MTKSTSWRGYDGEKDMTDEDWRQRGLEQATAMIHGLTPEYANLDEEGCPTGGCYNGDYPEEYHAKLNQQLEDDEYYEARVSADVSTLYKAHLDS